ncbi:MAG: hypothetical protein HEP71_25135 [Roseivirga sp.]|nr:hypothetical protein [Roseivirga sp.]
MKSAALPLLGLIILLASTTYVKSRFNQLFKDFSNHQNKLQSTISQLDSLDSQLLIPTYLPKDDSLKLNFDADAKETPNDARPYLESHDSIGVKRESEPILPSGISPRKGSDLKSIKAIPHPRSVQMPAIELSTKKIDFFLMYGNEFLISTETRRLFNSDTLIRHLDKRSFRKLNKKKNGMMLGIDLPEQSVTPNTSLYFFFNKDTIKTEFNNKKNGPMTNDQRLYNYDIKFENQFIFEDGSYEVHVYLGNAKIPYKFLFQLKVYR